MRWWLALFVMLSIGHAQAQTGEARPKQFGHWSAVCDGQGECAAWGVGATVASPGYVIVTFKGSRTTVRVGADRLPQGTPYTLTARVVSAAEKVLWSGSLSGPATFGRPSALVVAAKLKTVEAALAGGAEVQLFLSPNQSEPSAIISLTGSASALTWARNHARAPVKANVVHRAPKVDQSNLPKVKPPSAEGCEFDEEEVSASRLARNKVLWIVTCRAGYNNGSQLYITDDAGRFLPSLPIEAEGIETIDQLELDNIEYNAATRILRATTWEVGRGGCGDRSEWTWDGAKFRLSKVSGFYGCHGVDVRDWPVSYRAKVVDN